MVDRVGDWTTAFDLTGAVWLPLWAVAVLIAAAAVVGVLAFTRASFDGRIAVVGSALVLIVVLMGWGALDQLARGDRAAERRALDARASELATRALAPGSALACLDAIAGETVEDACERALFASPEATAAAVSYVAAQLALLNSAGAYAGRGGPNTTQLRRAMELDRFGIVAHVLAARDGCTPDRCEAFASLQDTRRVSANLAERPFEARIRSYSASWPAATARPVAANTPSSSPSSPSPPLPGVAAKVPNNLYFPSASSIPPVNIMTAEPSAPPQSHDTSGATDATTARRPAQGAPPARQPSSPGNAPARAAPLPLAPAQ